MKTANQHIMLIHSGTKIYTSDDISSSLEVYSDLLNIEYHFIIARKAQTIDIKLRFTKSEFFHLAGSQYLNDIADLENFLQLIRAAGEKLAALFA